MNAPLATPGPSIELASAWRREWRYSSWTVRFSALCLMVFYLFALFSRFFAPYEPTFQKRAMPGSPPMPVRIAARADWSGGLSYPYPLTMVDRVERRYAPQKSRRLYIRLFHRGHLFTTDSPKERFYLMGSDGIGRDLFSRIVYGARVSMFVGLIGGLLSLALGITIAALLGY